MLPSTLPPHPTAYLPFLPPKCEHLRQQLIESLGFHFVRVSAQQVEQDIEEVLQLIQGAFTLSEK
jgi:very-short-patch-repair endonuclease